MGQQMEGKMMPESHGWYAWYNHMPGADNTILRVTGVLEFTTGGHTAELVPHNVGWAPDDKLIALKVEVTDREVAPDVLQTLPVYWEDAVPGIQTVRIHGLEVNRYIDVQIVH